MADPEYDPDSLRRGISAMEADIDRLRCGIRELENRIDVYRFHLRETLRIANSKNDKR